MTCRSCGLCDTAICRLGLHARPCHKSVRQELLALLGRSALQAGHDLTFSGHLQYTAHSSFLQIVLVNSFF